jgi:DNA-binding SARP family transcriptional activator
VVGSLAREPDVNFDILGPVAIRDAGGHEIRRPAGRERSLLVLLLINRGDVVSTDKIIEALWGEQPPETAAKAVQGYVSHLRRTLDPERVAAGGAGGLLVTRAPGYALQAGADAIDATRFERLAARGSRALEEGAATEAAAMFDEALGLWRGPALAEFAFDDFAQTAIHRLEDLRLVALEDRADALLQLGRNAEVVAELDSLVAEHPLRERLRARLMLALYRTGRQADALQVYRDGRRLLAGELGLEPDPELQRLEQAILAQDPALGGPALEPPLMASEAAADEPPAPVGGRSRRRPLAVAAIVVLALAVATTVGFVLTRGDAPSAVTVVAPAVVAVDPETNRPIASIGVGSRPIAIAAGEGGIWVGDARDGTVTRIDPDSSSIVKVIGVGAPAVDLAAGAGSVWVATGAFGEVVQIDPELGAIENRIALGTPGDPIVPSVPSVAVGSGRVWAGSQRGLERIDPASGEISGEVNLSNSPALQIATGGGAVWATVFSSRAKRVEAASAKETAEFYAGSFVYPIGLDSDAVWIGGDEGQLWKVDPVTATQVLSVRIESFPSAIALGARSVWVALPGEGVLLRIDPRTGAIQARIELGGSPEDVVVANGLVWVAVGKAQS